MYTRIHSKTSHAQAFHALTICARLRKRSPITTRTRTDRQPARTAPAVRAGRGHKHAAQSRATPPRIPHLLPSPHKAAQAQKVYTFVSFIAFTLFVLALPRLIPSQAQQDTHAQPCPPTPQAQPRKPSPTAPTPPRAAPRRLSPRRADRKRITTRRTGGRAPRRACSAIADDRHPRGSCICASLAEHLPPLLHRLPLVLILPCLYINNGKRDSHGGRVLLRFSRVPGRYKAIAPPPRVGQKFVPLGCARFPVPRETRGRGHEAG